MQQYPRSPPQSSKLVPFWDSASQIHRLRHVENRMRGENRYFISVPVKCQLINLCLDNLPGFRGPSLVGSGVEEALTRITRVERGLVDIIAGRHGAGACRKKRERRIEEANRENKDAVCESRKFCRRPTFAAGLITLSCRVHGPALVYSRDN